MKGKNVWTFEQRVTLYLLWSDYKDITWQQRTDVFNQIFKDHLAFHGVPSGLPSKTLNSQISASERAKQHWVELVEAASHPDQKQLWERLKAKIDATLPLINSNGDPPTAVHKTPTTSHSALAAPTLPRSRKRVAVEVSTPPEEESDTELIPTTPSSKRRRTATYKVAAVASSSRLSVSAPAATPKTQRRSQKQLRTPNSRSEKDEPKYPCVRPDGSTLMLTAEKREQFNSPLVPVTDEQAFPKPGPELLFRFWHSASAGKNIAKGFLSGKHMHCNVRVPPAPAPENIDPVDVENHIRPHKVSSPFISTSSYLMWVIKKAVRNIKEGHTTSYISVIDARKLKEKSWYWLSPFHTMTKGQFPYDGEQRYNGTSEYLVYHKIPEEAMIHTVSTADFIDLIGQNRSVREILQLPVLCAERVGFAKALPQLKLANNTFTHLSIEAMVELLDFFGLDHTASVAQLSQVLCNISKFLGFKIEHATIQQWDDRAAHFAHRMARLSAEALSWEQIADLRRAFLDGARWAKAEFNAQYKEKGVKSMYLRAKKIGIESPATMVAQSLEGTGKRLIAREAEDARLLCERFATVTEMLPASGAAGLADEEDDQNEDEEAVVVATPSRASRVQLDDDIQYDDDSDGEFEPDSE